MNTSRLQLVILAAMVAVAGLGLLYFNRQGEQPVTTAPAGVGPELTVNVVIRAEADTLFAGPLVTEGPLSVLSALEQAAEGATLPVGIRQYDFGKLVVSIGSYTAGADGDWTYRVNDSLIPVAAESCQLADGDRLEFRFGQSSKDSSEPPDSSI